MSFSFTKCQFYKFKKVVSNKNLGFIVKTVMTRYVRFGTETTEVENLCMFECGNKNEIGTYIENVLLSKLLGNTVHVRFLLWEKTYR